MDERERETCGVAGHFTRSRSVSRLMYSVLRNRSHTRMDRAPHPSVGINEETWKLVFGKQDVKLPGPPLPAHGFDLTTNPDLPRAPRHNCPLHSLNVRYTQGVLYIYICIMACVLWLCMFDTGQLLNKYTHSHSLYIC